MPSRQFHRKSRHGCQKCKESKVRCGQEKPICKNCERLGFDCSFTSQPNLTSQQSLTASGAETHAVASSRGSVVPSPELQIQDLELMHHYSTATYFTMTDQIELYHVWQVNIPKHAINNSFLMRGLLALAALHLHEQHPSDAYLEIASYHQSKALEESSAQLSNITESNSNALFAFSSVIASIAFAFLRQTEAALSGQAFIDSISDIFSLLVGSKSVVIEGYQWVKTGDLSPMVGKNEGLGHDASLSELGRGASASLDSLFDVCQSLNLENAASYISAIEELRKVFASAQPLGNRPEMSTAIGWPVMVDSTYPTLVKQQDHLALTILAHYGAALHCINDVWFARGLGAHLVKAVVQVVELHWQSYLSWPVSWASIDRNAV